MTTGNVSPEMRARISRKARNRGELRQLIRLMDDRQARVFQCDCAERVIDIFDELEPDWEYPRQAIAGARLYLSGHATYDEMHDPVAGVYDAGNFSDTDAGFEIAHAIAWIIIWEDGHTREIAEILGTGRDNHIAYCAQGCLEGYAIYTGEHALPDEVKWQTERAIAILNAENETQDRSSHATNDVGRQRISWRKAYDDWLAAPGNVTDQKQILIVDTTAKHATLDDYIEKMNDRQTRLFLADCTERVIDIFVETERTYTHAADEINVARRVADKIMSYQAGHTHLKHTTYIAASLSHGSASWEIANALTGLMGWEARAIKVGHKLTQIATGTLRHCVYGRAMYDGEDTIDEEIAWQRQRAIDILNGLYD